MLQLYANKRCHGHCKQSLISTDTLCHGIFVFAHLFAGYRCPVQEELYQKSIIINLCVSIYTKQKKTKQK